MGSCVRPLRRVSSHQQDDSSSCISILGIYSKKKKQGWREEVWCVLCSSVVKCLDFGDWNQSWRSTGLCLPNSPSFHHPLSIIGFIMMPSKNSKSWPWLCLGLYHGTWWRISSKNGLMACCNGVEKRRALSPLAQGRASGGGEPRNLYPAQSADMLDPMSAIFVVLEGSGTCVVIVGRVFVV